MTFRRLTSNADFDFETTWNQLSNTFTLGPEFASISRDNNEWAIRDVYMTNEVVNVFNVNRMSQRYVFTIRIFTNPHSGKPSFVRNLYSSDIKMFLVGDYCGPSTCKNGGHCVTVSGEWQCNCPQYYGGDYCEICDGENVYGTPPNCKYCSRSETCNGHGACNNDGFCECDEGYTGSDCSQCTPNYYPDGDICRFCEASSVCNGHGTCNANGNCLCNNPIDGDRYCSIVSTASGGDSFSITYSFGSGSTERKVFFFFF